MVVVYGSDDDDDARPEALGRVSNVSEDEQAESAGTDPKYGVVVSQESDVCLGLGRTQSLSWWERQKRT